jgi:hypothetical protein
VKPRLLTPIIAVVSFAATAALLAEHTYVWRAAAGSAAPLAKLALPPTAVPLPAEPATTAAAGLPAAQPAPQEESVDPPPPVAPAADADDPRGGRDRAAGHSARTR